ncbi:PTS N-acetyl-D-glucosamine transporter [Sphingomonas ginkgonis]|uniref:PTS N-acetyl-D-glucosamine transporter n=1 Tax=Sphingomonas ginkgonis TaxID=2315330 RepID=A0A3R9Z576_9SPHN|nr:N-acetylglucosamine-specific PTS transporter subunit IIBC [Sphingomonas ginkgonis]RST30059.1 PTS N-acetyl-D-glucosamine transporter [Sphingomonas ginkgonis]
MRSWLDRFQPLGRALMLPIAVLPVAALLLRLGQDDVLAIPFIAAAGQAIFDHLGLLFAAGVAVGLARENHGAAALAGIVCYLVATEGAKPLLAVPPDALVGATDTTRDLFVGAWKAKQIAKLSVPAGILSGLIAGALYNRYSAITLPSYLGFFAGRRFVPIVAGVAGVGLALAFGGGFPLFEAGVDQLSHWIIAAGPVGLFLYGLLNRLLLVTGLHHILNNLAWFLVGDFHGATGDLKRFFAGDPTAGAFMSGFFPVMMFGLPAACLAMYRAALPTRRKEVAGLYLSLALTSLLTGVTEPIEFTFLFLAPLLFAVHAVLTGLAMVTMDLLGAKLGFGFSAGLFDYVLNYGLATRPLLLLPVGAVYALVYYGVFSWAIRRFDLKLPGRDADAAAILPATSAGGGDRAEAFAAALGGPDNLASIDACTTRLRLHVDDPGRIDRPALAALGARGVLDLGGGSVQVVVGPEADQLASALRAVTRRPEAGNTAANATRGISPGSDDQNDLNRLLAGLDRSAVDQAGRRLVIPQAADHLDHRLQQCAEVRAVARVGEDLHVFLTLPAGMLLRPVDPASAGPPSK